MCRSSAAGLQDTHQAPQDSVWVYFLAGKRHELQGATVNRISSEREWNTPQSSSSLQLFAPTNQHRKAMLL